MKIGDLVKTTKEGIIGVIVGEIKSNDGQAIGYSGDVFAVAIVAMGSNEERWREMGWKHQIWDFYPSQLELLQ